MARIFQEKKLIIATHNPDKKRELEFLLKDFDIEILSAGDLGLAEPEETGVTFIQNALIKAVAATRATGLPALADDSGLCVGALHGLPGIYSARWGGPEKDFGAAMAQVHEAAQDHPDKSAYFVSALALTWPDGHAEFFEEYMAGSLVWPPRGDQGFGYDPMFVAKGMDQTFGELTPEHKNTINHRAKAFQSLVAACFQK